MGIEPQLFGPYVWAAIHLICLGAPASLTSEQKTAYKTFFDQMPYVLPCASCGRHLMENMVKVPIDPALTGADDLFKWSVDLHNKVNIQLGKPTMTSEQALLYWKSVSYLKDRKNESKCKTSTICFNYIVTLSLGILLGAFLVHIIKPSPRLTKR